MCKAARIVAASKCMSSSTHTLLPIPLGYLIFSAQHVLAELIIVSTNKSWCFPMYHCQQVWPLFWCTGILTTSFFAAEGEILQPVP